MEKRMKKALFSMKKITVFSVPAKRAHTPAEPEV